ncbi:surface antigen-like protein [Fibrobacter sp. UWR4]|nr:surface antigen-like protein [Fibrobacter sp. UWR4]PZW73117.1 surface antigen-like protein [Fibrobacter sp. UWR1]
MKYIEVEGIFSIIVGNRGIMFFNFWKKFGLKGLSVATALALSPLHAQDVSSQDSVAIGGCPEGTVLTGIALEGLENTNPRVIHRELLNKVGEAYSSEKFQAEKHKLEDLDLFTDVALSCDGNGVAHYQFKEIFRWIPAPAGKSTDRDGLMIGLALANLNVLGEDIRVEVQYRTTLDPFLENNEYALYASSPYLFGLPLGWNFEFLRTDSWDDLRTFQDNSYLADLDLDYEVRPGLSLLGTMALRYLYGAAGLPELGLGFAFDFRDSKLDSRRGVYFEYMLTHVGYGDDHEIDCKEGPCDDLGGENFNEFLIDARAYFTLWRFVTGATALVRYRPGDVERYDYFYHGGANTFRGHEASSDRLGVHEALLTLEERFVLRERKPASLWGINFFYGLQLVAGLDGSLLWDKGRPSWDNYEGAVYGGLHLVIPALDRVRFEVGYSPDRKEPKFYFGLFDRATTARWRNR